MDPVEEYSALKEEIRRLEDRLAVLREGFLQPGARLRSNRHEVVVRQQGRKVFLRDRLPAATLNDPQYWEDRLSVIVTVRSLDPAPPRRRRNDDEIVLVE